MLDIFYIKYCKFGIKFSQILNKNTLYIYGDIILKNGGYIMADNAIPANNIYRPRCTRTNKTYESYGDYTSYYYKVAYLDHDKKQKVTYLPEGPGLDVINGIREYAFKDTNKNHGVIKAEDAYKIVNNVFLNRQDTSAHGWHTVSYSSGQVTLIQSLFAHHMSEDSPGGRDITQQEQFDIAQAIAVNYGKNKL